MPLRPHLTLGRLLCAFACTALFGLLLLGSGPASAETVTLPSGAAPAGTVTDEILATACPGTGDCVAVGFYGDNSGHYQGLIETESGGIWTATSANLSALSANSNPYAVLTSVSCSSVGNCVAVGTYESSSGAEQPLIVSESGGNWTASEPDLTPIGISSNPELAIASVTCPSTGNCVAVGFYEDTSNSEQALILTESGGTWTASKAPLTGLGAGSNPEAQLDAVSCASAGNCAAVGDYGDGSGHDQGLIETDVNGSWTPSKANLTALPTVGSNPNVSLKSVSCASAGDCSATGSYVDGSAVDGSYQGLLISSTGGSWAPATEATLPANAYVSGNTHTAQRDLSLGAISCSTPGNCTAVGSYDVTSANDIEGLELTQSGGVWSSGVETSLPVAGATDPETMIDSVVCRSAGSCTAAGTYLAGNGTANAIILTQTAGVWSSAATPIVTDATSAIADRVTLSCSASAYCIAAGYDYPGTGTVDSPFLLDAPGAAATPSATDSYTQAAVSWSAPTDNGGLPVTGYSVSATDLTAGSRGGQTVSTTSTSTTITGLTPGDSYTFTVTPQSALGNGLPATSGTVVALASSAQITASLTPLLHPTGKNAKPKAVTKHHGYTFAYGALEPGRVVVDWYQITRQGRHRRKHRTLIASGAATATQAGSTEVKVTLTGLGPRLIKVGKPIHVTAIVSFTADGTTTSRTSSFTLR